MRASFLRNMTWEDIREIFTVFEQTAGDDTTSDKYYKSVIRILRGKNGIPPPIEEVYPFILSCAELVCGRQLTDTREMENSLIRCFVAYKLHNNGYSYSEIGKMLKRDHSTITHLSNRMRDMLSLPNAYKWEVQQYKRFDELL